LKDQNVFQNSKKCNEEVFIDDQDINGPTLLISAQFKTHHWLLKHFPNLSILPEGERIGLKIYFENLYNEEIAGYKNVQFFIFQHENIQKRFWRLNLPNLKHKGDFCVAEIETLIKPEVSGNHYMFIKKVNGLQYADKHGLTNRPYKVCADNWPTSFYVCSKLEFGFYKISFVTLTVSFIALLVSIISLFSTTN
jgi:hypothetical protein